MDSDPLKSSEAYFAHRDAFVAYVEEQVNPARKAEGLDTVSAGAASRLFDIAVRATYLRGDAPTCPHCGSDGFKDGPRGWFCGNENCRAELKP